VAEVTCLSRVYHNPPTSTFRIKVIHTEFKISKSVVIFHVLTVANMKTTVFWDSTACSLVEVNRRFRDANFLHHQLPR
jgi:hypothetical protein